MIDSPLTMSEKTVSLSLVDISLEIVRRATANRAEQLAFLESAARIGQPGQIIPAAARFAKAAHHLDHARAVALRAIQRDADRARR